MQHRAIVLGLALQAAAMALAGGGLRGQTATVEVENELDRDLLIWIDGEPRGVVPANDRIAFDGLPDGPVTLLASGLRREGIEASERRVLAPGESFTWVLYPIPVLGEEQGTGILVVTNELDVPAEITAGGNMLGWVSPSGARSFPNLVAGTFPVEARDAEQDLLERTNVTIDDGAIARWVIGGP